MDTAAIQRQLFRRNVQRFREGLAFEAHGLLHHSTLGPRVIKKKKKKKDAAALGVLPKVSTLASNLSTLGAHVQ